MQRRKAKAKAPRKPKTRTLPTDFGGSAQLKDRLQSAQLQKGARRQAARPYSQARRRVTVIFEKHTYSSFN
jgi:hypothetical protein